MRLSPTRLRRLREVEAGQVWRYGDGQDYAATGHKVTAALVPLWYADLIRLGEHGPVKTPWELTPSGRAVLARHREATK